MIDDYQLRKDIDIIIRFIEGLEDNTSLKELLGKFYDQSEVDVVTAKLNSDLTTLDTDLDALKGNLVVFNQKLITFNGDTETLATDLSTLGNNLNSVLGDITTLSTDLSTLSGNLDTLDGDFTTLDRTLSDLSTTVGNLDTDVGNLQTTVGDNNSGLVKGLNDVSTSLIGTDGDLRNLITDLETLADCMTNFEGSLSDFQQELIDNNVELDTLTLQSDIIKLFGALSSVKNDVSTVEDDMYGANGTSANPANGSVLANISDVQDTIGDTDTSGTVLYNINQVQTDIGDTNTSGTIKYNINQAQTNITNTQNTLYGGSGHSTSNPSSNSVMGNISTVQEDMYGSNKDPANPQSGSVVSDLSTAQGTINTIVNTDIPAVQGSIGDVQDIMYGNGDVQNPETGSLLDNVNTVQSDITDVQGDIGTFDRTVHGSLYTQITNLDSISDFIVATNYSWQILWIGARDNVSWKTLIESTGILRHNINYAYDGNFYVSDGVTWSQYNNSVILDNVEFACAVVDRFNASTSGLAEDINIDRIYDVSTNTWYQYSSNSWSSVSSPDVYMEICLSKIVNSNIGGGISGLNPQSEINDNLLSEIGNKQDSIPNMTLRQTITQGNVVIRIYSDDLYVYVVASGSVSQNGNINLTDTIDSAYCPFSDSVYELDGTGNAHKIILFESGAIRLVTGSGTDTLNLKMTCMYPLLGRLPSGVSQ